jgi:hypothetical protein
LADGRTTHKGGMSDEIDDDPVGVLSSYEAPKPHVIHPDGRITFANGAAYRINDISIGDVCRVGLNPGEILVVKTDQRLSRHEAEALRAYVAAQIPGHPCLILDAGMSLAIVGRD